MALFPFYIPLSPEFLAHLSRSIRCPSERPSVRASAETDVYLCVLNHGHLTLISMRFIPYTHKLTDLCVENYLQSTLVCCKIDTQGYFIGKETHKYTSVKMSVRKHFQTQISPQPVGQL